MTTFNFGQSISHLVGCRVKLHYEDRHVDGMSARVVGMLERVDLAAKTIKLEGFDDTFSFDEVETVSVVNYGFQTRRQRRGDAAMDHLS